jgi:hypothetical protein
LTHFEALEPAPEARGSEATVSERGGIDWSHGVDSKNFGD